MTLVSVCDSKAAAKSIVLLSGESHVLSPGIGKIKSLKSSKKNIVSLTKKGKKCTIVAKNVGTTTITVKAKKKTVKYKVTVKNVSFDMSVVSVSHIEGYYGTTSRVAVKIVNDSGSYIDSGVMHCNLLDGNGAVIKQEKNQWFLLIWAWIVFFATRIIKTRMKTAISVWI